MNNEIWLKFIEEMPQIITIMQDTSNNTLIIIAVIGTIPGTIAALFAGLALWRSTRNAKTLVTVEKKVDGMTSDLVAATSAAKFAEGKLDERDAERIHLSEMPIASMPVVNGSDDDPLKVKLVKNDKKLEQ